MIAVTVALLALAPSAAARTVFDAGPESYWNDWRVVSGGLVRTDAEFDGPFDVTFVPKRGRARVLPQFRRVARLTAPRDPDAYRRHREASFDASGRRVVLGVSTYNVLPGDGAAPDAYIEELSELWTATLDGDPVKLHGCKRGNVGPVSTDGDQVAWVGTRCGSLHTTIGVRDMTGARPPLELSAPERRAFRDVQIAGDFVLARIYEPTDFPGSAVAPDELVVHSRATGAELYRVPEAEDYDLQPDGKLAALRTTQPDCGDRVAWHSPAEPEAHVLAPEACEDVLFMANDRILWSRQVGAARGETAATDLAGGTVQPLFPAEERGGERELVRSAFHFDGRRVAYFLSGCGSDSVVVDTVDALVTGDPAPVEPCTAALGAVPPVARLNRLDAFVVTIGCPRGCRYSEVALWDVAARRSLALVAQDETRPSRSLPDMRAGGRRRVQLRLTAAGRRRVERVGRLRVELRVHVTQPDERNRTFAKRLTLVAGS